MSKTRYQELDREYRQKDLLYPDRGRSIRPWEAPLKETIRQEVAKGIEAGHAWATQAAIRWHIGLDGQFLP